MGITGSGDFAIVIASDAPEWKQTFGRFVCDGVNDEKTILDALDSFNDSGGLLMFSEGTLHIDESKWITNAAGINITSNVHIRGAGRGLTTFSFVADRSVNNDRYMFRVDGSSDNAVQNWSIRDLSIVCQRASDHGIGIGGTSKFLIENVSIAHSSYQTSIDEGIQFTGATGGVEDGTLRNMLISGFNLGIEHRAGPNYCRNIRHYDVIADGCIATGIQSLRTSGGNPPLDLEFHGCWGNNMFGSGGDGWNLDGAQDVRIFGGGAKGNAGDGLNLGATNNNPARCVIQGGVWRSNGASGIVVRGSNHRFIGNTAIDNVASGFRPADSSAGANWFQNNLALGDSIEPTNGFKENSNPTGNVYIGNHAEGSSNNWALGTNYSTISNNLNTGTSAPSA